MIIPEIITWSGDVEKAKTLIKFSKEEMGRLERDMAFRGLDQWERKRVPFPGGLITCTKEFGTRRIHIHVPIKPSKGGHLEALIEEKDCLCNCNFSAGQVVQVDLKASDDDANLYSVLACNSKSFYALYENILASDFAEYEEGDIVIVMAYNTFDYLCCSGHEGATSCGPIISEYAIESVDWRTTYRILPWCGAKLPQWVNERMVKKHG